MKYKRVVISRYGGPEVLRVVEDELPEPGTGKVRVKILAAGVAFADVLMREGLYPGVPPIPFSPGYEVVGVVEKLGPGVLRLKLGQVIAALTVHGGYGEFLCLPAEELVPMPSALDPVEAVSVVLNYVTAYQILHRIACVKPRERVLIHGAAGGVGTALLQIGSLAELEMYGTASKSKHELVSALGGNPIDYRSEDFVLRIRNLTGDGVDAVFDPIGGRHYWRSYKTLRAEGRLIGFGFSSVLTGKRFRSARIAFSFLQFWLLKHLPGSRKAIVYGINSLRKCKPEWFRQDLTALFDLLLWGKIKPIIAERIPLVDAARAHRLLEKAAVRGKIVLISKA